MAQNKTRMYEDLYLLAVVSSTVERYSTEKPSTPYATEYAMVEAATCTSNMLVRRIFENNRPEEEKQSTARKRILTRMPGDEILYGPGRFWKKRECHRCITEVGIEQLEQRIEKLRDVLSFWEFLRKFLQNKAMNPLLERAICAFMEAVNNA